MSLFLSFDVDIDKLLDTENDDLFTRIDTVRVATVSEQGRRPAHIYFSAITSDGCIYPDSTGLNCWWCRHGFSWRPMGNPIAFLKDRDAFVCNGIFCSFSCLRAYIKDRNEDETLLTSIFLRSGGELPIATAKSWKELKEYGGTLEIDKFREKGNRVEIAATLLSSSVAFMSVDRT